MQTKISSQTFNTLYLINHWSDHGANTSIRNLRISTSYGHISLYFRQKVKVVTVLYIYLAILQKNMSQNARETNGIKLVPPFRPVELHGSYSRGVVS